MPDFLHHHVGHHVGRGPHAFADLRSARKAAGKADLDVARLIGLYPAAGFHLRLADHRASLHRGVHFVAGAIQEAGVDEDDPVFHRMNARGEVSGRAAFFVHHADLDGVTRKAKHIFNRIEQCVGQRGFFGAVHLGLYDVD